MWEQLIKAIKEGKVDEAKTLIAEMTTAELDQTDAQGMNALHWVLASVAIKDEDSLIEICKPLIAKMSNEAINAQCNSGKTALHFSSLKNKADVCELLLNNMEPETVDVIDKEGKAALHWAVGFFDDKLCMKFISMMSVTSLNSIAHDGTSALYQAAARLCKSSNKNEVCLKLAAVADEKVMDSKLTMYQSNELIHWIVLTKDLELIASCLKKMSSNTINGVRVDGFTALHLSALSGSDEVCKLLIPKMNNTGINAVSRELKTAADIAYDNGHNETLELLKSHGCVQMKTENFEVGHDQTDALGEDSGSEEYYFEDCS